MTFKAMHGRLLVIARERVGNGEITESHLARLMGISQSHIHNVLKGTRKLSSELADEILNQLRLDTNDLLVEASPVNAQPFRSVPLLSGALGIEMHSFEPKRTAGSALVPAKIVSILGCPVAARLGEDLQISPRFEEGDLVLIEQTVAARRRVVKDAVYVVMTTDGPRLRYIRQGSGRLYLASEECLQVPGKWESVGAGCRSLLGIVRGRVVWVSRDLKMEMAG